MSGEGTRLLAAPRRSELLSGHQMEMQPVGSSARRNRMSRLLAADLDHVLAHTTGLWDELRGQRIFITGGTGFFGCWLLERFTYAADALDLGATAVVLTRDAEAFQRKAPHIAAHPAVELHFGK